MTETLATALSEIILCAGTAVLGLTVGPRKSYRTWTAFFLTLSIAAGLGAAYYGFERAHTSEFWKLVATTTIASSFLFLSASLCAIRPQWKWMHWLWPIMGLAGLVFGGLLAPFPFFYLSAVTMICILISIFILQKSQSVKARNWIYAGICTVILGFTLKHVTHGSGILNHNSVFHYFQLCGNYLVWTGARKT